MTLTDQQIEELQEAAKSLVEFLNKHCHPHTKIVVHSTGAELLEGVATVKLSTAGAWKNEQELLDYFEKVGITKGGNREDS